MVFRILVGGTGGQRGIERKSGEAGDPRLAAFKALFTERRCLIALLLIASVNIADDRASGPANHGADASVATA